MQGIVGEKRLRLYKDLKNNNCPRSEGTCHMNDDNESVLQITVCFARTFQQINKTKNPTEEDWY